MRGGPKRAEVGLLATGRGDRYVIALEKMAIARDVEEDDEDQTIILRPGRFRTGVCSDGLRQWN